ncbi:MAG: hypothetical protein N2654_04035 [Deltaproteobacteria bacterium]|nr:hypothetical protein [Deltaproteobacteria bacterium]
MNIFDALPYLIWSLPLVLSLLAFLSSAFSIQADKNLKLINAKNLAFALTAFCFCYLLDLYISPFLEPYLIKLHPALPVTVKILYIIPSFVLAHFLSRAIGWLLSAV